MLAKLPGGHWIISRINLCGIYLRFGENPSPSIVFPWYYDKNVCKDTETVSGPGSTVRYTKNIRAKLPGLIKDLKVRTILDAPCGDFNWFRLVELPKDVYYIGGDIIRPLIVKNQALYGNADRTFVCIDITKDKLPDADIWICRDAFIHFSDEYIFLSVRNFINSSIRYILTTSYTESGKNRDIPTGFFRLLNLELPPFNFPKPILTIDDWVDGYPVRKLCLWERQALSHCLERY